MRVMSNVREVLWTARLSQVAQPDCCEDQVDEQSTEDVTESQLAQYISKLVVEWHLDCTLKRCIHFLNVK